MPFLPVLNNNIDQSPSFNSPIRPSAPKNLLDIRFLLLVFSILLIIVLFLIGFLTGENAGKPKTQTDLEVLSNELAQTGEGATFIDNYQAYIKKIQNEQDSTAKYKLTFNLAQGFLAQYSADHNPKLRLLEEKLSAYAKVNFGDRYEAGAFSVLCLDTECGKLEYTPEIIEIKKQVESADLGLNKPSILNALENASYVTSDTKLSKDIEYSSLGAALMLLNIESQSGKTAANDIEKKLLAYTTARFPNFVNPFESTNSAVRR